MTDLSHKDLIERAARWLRGRGKARHGPLANLDPAVIILTEPGLGYGETPDAIGWTRLGGTIVIECKVSRSDFLNDARKPWRSWCGVERYYLAGEHVCSEAECEARGHGLLRTSKSGVRVAAMAPVRTDVNRQQEARLLTWAMRRLAGGCPPPSLWIKAYRSHQDAPGA